MLEGEDPTVTERLWREMFDGTIQIGRVVESPLSPQRVRLQLDDTVEIDAAAVRRHQPIGGVEAPFFGTSCPRKDRLGESVRRPAIDADLISCQSEDRSRRSGLQPRWHGGFTQREGNFL